MSEFDLPTEPHGDGITRRDVMFGLGLAAGAAAGYGLSGASAAALAPAGQPSAAGRPSVGPFPQAVTIPDAALTYLSVDGSAFHTQGGTRYLDNVTGANAGNGRLIAPLTLEVGAVVRQLRFAYETGVGDASLQIVERKFGPPAAWTPVATAVGPGSNNVATVNLATPVTIGANSSYSLAMTVVSGMSLMGVNVGYTPAAARFIPFAGGVPRVYDSRDADGPMIVEEERTVNLGFVGGRAALLNVTITATTGLGFIAAFAGDIAYPGNSTVNWSSAGLTTANGAVVAMSPTGTIKLRCDGAGTTQVVVDRLGWFV